MRFHITEIISLFIGFLGLLMAFVCLFVSKIKKEIKISLTSLLLITSLIVLVGTLNYTGNSKYAIHLFRLDSPIHYLLGPAIFLYTLAVINPAFQFRKVHLIHLLPFIVNFIVFIPFYSLTSVEKSILYAEFIEKGTVVIPFQYFIKTVIMTIYFLAQLYLFKKFSVFNLLKSNKDYYICYWFFIFFGAQFILLTGVILDQALDLKLINDPYQFAMIMVALFQFIIITGLLIFPVLLYGKENLSKDTKEKYTQSRLENESKNLILEELAEIMVSQKLYLNERLSLNSVAEILKIRPQQLSQVINEKTANNFNDYINSYRIEEAKEILTSSSLIKLTIEAIALKAGFNSKSAFYSAFKKQTGQTPKAFLDSNKTEKQIAVS